MIYFQDKKHQGSGYDVITPKPEVVQKIISHNIVLLINILYKKGSGHNNVETVETLPYGISSTPEMNVTTCYSGSGTKIITHDHVLSLTSTK